MDGLGGSIHWVWKINAPCTVVDAPCFLALGGFSSLEWPVGVEKQDRDFRCCAKCDDQQRKYRNRNFNAAIDILKFRSQDSRVWAAAVCVRSMMRQSSLSVGHADSALSEACLPLGTT